MDPDLDEIVEKMLKTCLVIAKLGLISDWV